MSVLDVSWADENDDFDDGESRSLSGTKTEVRIRVPRSVRSFDISMRRKDRDKEASYVFVVWLARRHVGGVFSDGTTQAIGREEFDLAVCASPDTYLPVSDEIGSLNINDFFAEVPLEEDYELNEDGELPESYQADYVEAVTRIINAKNACKNCPLRMKCLTDSILMGDEDKEFGQNSNVRPLPGIWGGREIKDRKSIARKFKAIRNEYLSGEMVASEKKMYEAAALRFLDERP